MIKPLRRKFVLTNMLMVLLVTVVAFYCNYAFNRANMLEESISVMQNTISEGTPKNMKTFLVAVNNYGNIYQIKGYSGSVANDLDELSTIVNAVLRCDSDVGDITSHDLRFMRQSTPNGTYIAFTNTAEEKIALKGIIDFSVYIFICCSLIFLLISIYLGRLTTWPVERSFNQKKQLISDASHELKTPVTAIIASADVLLSSQTLSAEDRSWVNSIKESATDMSSLLTDMLSLAKADGEKAVVELGELDFSTLAASVALNYEAVFFESNKQFDYEIDSGISIKGSDKMLKQLLRIFLDNAKKYSNENGRITLSLKKVKDKAQVTVFNTGAQIPADEIDKIFDRFYRVDKVRSAASGYGLGLSIAKNIADVHSTKITVESDENGTKFSVLFKALK